MRLRGTDLFAGTGLGGGGGIAVVLVLPPVIALLSRPACALATALCGPTASQPRRRLGGGRRDPDRCRPRDPRFRTAPAELPCHAHPRLPAAWGDRRPRQGATAAASRRHQPRQRPRHACALRLPRGRARGQGRGRPRARLRADDLRAAARRRRPGRRRALHVVVRRRRDLLRRGVAQHGAAALLRRPDAPGPLVARAVRRPQPRRRPRARVLRHRGRRRDLRGAPFRLRGGARPHAGLGARGASRDQAMAAVQDVREAGYLYVTSGVLPDPWRTLPSYLREEERALETCP